MRLHLCSAAMLLITALTPLSVSAQNLFGIDLSDLTLTAFTSVSTQLAPIQTDFDSRPAPGSAKPASLRRSAIRST